MKTTFRSFCLTVALGVAPAMSFAVPASASETHQAKFPIADARAKALGVVPGVIVDEELEHEGGRWIYSFEIKPTGEKGKLIKEVNIDADTGALISVATEDD